MDKPYYFITVFNRLDLDEKGWPDTGAMRPCGFYSDKDTAYQAISENWTDIWERCYHYGVVEEINEGILNSTGNRQFFKYNSENDMYEEIDEPAGYEHFHGFAFS